ncbi:MAG: hypothetical protein ACFB15_25860 [Cyclobacteriaceae bacterium]
MKSIQEISLPAPSRKKMIVARRSDQGEVKAPAVIPKNPLAIRQPDSYPISPMLQADQKQIVRMVYESPRIMDLVKTEKGLAMVAALAESSIRKAVTHMGYTKYENLDKTTTLEIKMGIVDVLCAHKWLRFEEAKHIIQQGQQGFYSEVEVFGYNASTVNKWIQLYEQKRMKAMKEQMSFEAPLREEPKRIIQNLDWFADAYRQVEEATRANRRIVHPVDFAVSFPELCIFFYYDAQFRTYTTTRKKWRMYRKLRGYNPTISQYTMQGYLRKYVFARWVIGMAYQRKTVEQCQVTLKNRSISYDTH